MIDIHSHFIYGVDDGPSTIKESIRMVLEAERFGVTAIVATPHYNDANLESRSVTENFAEIASRTANCDIELYMGYEILITPTLLQDIKVNNLPTLNQSRYLLFELPYDEIPEYSTDFLYRLNLGKIIPIIAHPERNRRLSGNMDLFIRFIEGGCLVQLDTGSILGVYGTSARSFAKKLIQLNMAHFVASDAHCPNDYLQGIPAAYHQVQSWAGKEFTDRVFMENPKMILNRTAVNLMK
jgi:protein-tyrosine phosphatase